MARVKICPVCKHHNGELEDQCQNCPAFLIGVIAREPSEIGLEETITPTEAPTEPPVLVLIFPWGEETIGEETLLGVDNPRFGARIDGAANGDRVSGAHAMVWCRDNRFFIRHLSTTNLTFLDDEEVEEEAELRDGQRLSLSRHFHLTVRIR